MEGGELSLDDSLKLFEEGIKLSRDCNKELSEAEQKVKKLVGVDAEGEPVLEDFDK
jgi:exodeoxyribonuclease VII small subunit